MSISNAVSDAPKGKGGAAETARPIQDFAMLKVAEKPVEGNVPTPRYHTVSDLRRAAIWLDSQVAKSGGKVSSQVVDLTPDLASLLLERNPGNRTLRPSKIADLAKDMSAGNWKLNGEPLIVSQDGLLNDGQHRCAAVVESKIPVPVVMVFGVERDSRDTLDQSTPRTAGDFLAMHDMANAKHLAAAARALWQYQTYGFLASAHQKYSPTRSEIKATALSNPGLASSLAYVQRPGAKTMRQPSLLAFCHFAFKRMAGETAADFFMDSFIDGANLKRSDPILYVRNRLIAERKLLKLEHRAELLFKAWNAHRLDLTNVTFRITGGELPMLEA